MYMITDEKIDVFKIYLISEEKTQATITKYMHDIRDFKIWLEGKELSKIAVSMYKSYICERYAPASVNSAISALNGFFLYNKWFDLRVKKIKIQRQIFASSDKELTKVEYDQLLRMAQKKGNERLYMVMQTICSTGIRISELKFITVESLKDGRTEILCKGKNRVVFLPEQLCKMLKKYVLKNKIQSGAIFITKMGNPLDRSNIWSDMKKLCKEAGVSEEKVFPHNLRHLFARTYYSSHQDIVRLADILGHSSVNTTRIYTMETGEIHRKQIQGLGLLRCSPY